jgi:hypothetical protein
VQKMIVSFQAGQPEKGCPTVWLSFLEPGPMKLPYIPTKHPIVVDKTVSATERIHRLGSYPDFIREIVAGLVDCYLHSISGDSITMTFHFFAGAKVGGLEEHNRANLAAVRQVLDDSGAFFIEE